jgi:eukaryotic-like serine/threonine-protein kinase
MRKQGIGLYIFLSGLVLLVMAGCGQAALTSTLGVGSTQVSKTDEMVLVYVPQGQFLMGITDKEIDTFLSQYSDWDREMLNTEKPQHTVVLDAFWIDKTEVTNAQYQKCVKAGSCTAPHESSSYTRSFYFGNPDYASYPVIFVDWDQAAAYCKWAGRRLPSEAEWEKAARGTDGREFPWGNEGLAGDLLNFADKNSEWAWANQTIDDGYTETAPVGHYPKGASIYGALDMAGNVWEWVNDWYQEDYYQNSPAKNPPGPASGTDRVLRGGSWGFDLLDVRTTYRAMNAPADFDINTGFRCAATP